MKKERKYAVEVSAKDLHLMMEALVTWRNNLLAENPDTPTEDIENLLVRVINKI